MAETELERYRRKFAENKVLEPKPATPIEGLEIDPGEENGVTITTNTKGQEILLPTFKTWIQDGLVFPTVTLTDAQMDGLCAFWTKAKTAVKP